MDDLAQIIEILSLLAIPLLVLVIVIHGAVKKVKIYEAFVEGAREGFTWGCGSSPTWWPCWWPSGSFGPAGPWTC